MQAYLSSEEARTLLQVSGRFESSGGSLQLNEDLGKEGTTPLTYFLKDFPESRLVVLGGERDLVGLGEAVRAWLDSELDFLEKADWNKLKYGDWVVDGAKAGLTKAVRQVMYYALEGRGGRVWRAGELAALLKGVYRRE